MKQFIYLILLFGGTRLATAQDFILVPSDSVSGTLDVSGPYLKNITLNIDIINTTANDLDIKWVIIEKQFLNEWSFTVCNQDYCTYPPIPDSSDIPTIPPYDTGFIKVSVYDSITPGDGHIKFYIYSNTKSSDTLSYYFSFFLSVPENEPFRNILVYPSYASDVLCININPRIHGNLDAELFSIAGKKEALFRLTGGLNKLNVSHIAGGCYFLRIYDESGRSSTYKFIKSLLH